jgi:sec-independent protein translocase protein TatB
MFLDIGWSEMLVIAVVAFIVIGPKELPQVLRTMAGLAAKARAAGRVFQQQLDEVMREAGAADLKRQVDDAINIDPQRAAERAITGTVDPEGEFNRVWNGPPDLTTPTEANPAVPESDTAPADPSTQKPPAEKTP